MTNSNYNKIAGRDTARIVAISDGVFAVAMTLLVLEIRVPVIESINSEKQLIDAFLSLNPKFLIYFLSFMTAGIFWMGHSAQFKHIEQSDRNMSWINLLFLLTVTLLPFTTAFLGDYTEFRFPVAVYWFNIFLMGLMLFINWVYACKHGFVSQVSLNLVDKPIRRRIIVAQSLYLFGALLCLINPYISIGFIIIIQINYAFAFIAGKK